MNRSNAVENYPPGAVVDMEARAHKRAVDRLVKAVAGLDSLDVRALAEQAELWAKNV